MDWDNEVEDAEEDQMKDIEDK